MVTVDRTKDPRIIGYPNRLNWYRIPPPYELSLELFETYALDRLQVLRAIESAQIRNIRKDEELRSYLNDVMLKYMPLGFNSARDITSDEQRAALFNERKKDHISHFILRLAYCRNTDLRNWFLKMETELFRLRLTVEIPESRQKVIIFRFIDHQFVKEALLSDMGDLKNVVDKELQSVIVKELSFFLGKSEEEIIKQNFFKVPFQKVPDLVMKRAVIVKKGFAYVPSSMESTLIVNEFKEKLSIALEETAKALPRMDEDDRLDPILESISKQYISTRKSYGASGPDAKVSHDDIDGLSTKHFPLCMSTLHKYLRSDAHLKHSPRLQYGLFLKGIGLPVEESLIFWRKAFHKMNDEAFQKGGYSYNIRHNYGLEGKRSDYLPYNCVKIITTNPPASSDRHGCPFKHYNQENLKSLLTQTLTLEGKQGTTVTNSVNELLKMTTDGHFQVACTRLFEMTHSGIDKAVDTIEHPNMWFEMSRDGVSTNRRSKVPLKVSKSVEDVFMDDDIPDSEVMNLEDNMAVDS